jgi:hypothetical protein
MKYKVLMSLVIIGLLLIPLACQDGQGIPPQDWVVANETEFLEKCEHSNITFRKATFGNHTSYYYHRMIGNAIVEFDRMTYRFDKETGEFIEKRVYWRDDLPDELPPIISEEDAMTIGGGTKAVLFYIDPESNVFAEVEPTPENPCWAVLVYDNKGCNTDVIVVDAVTGEILGHGTPIP